MIDCDLQHPPEKLVEMYRLWEQGVEVVEGVKTDRGGVAGSPRGREDVLPPYQRGDAHRHDARLGLRCSTARP